MDKIKNIQDYWTKLSTLTMEYAPKVISSIIYAAIILVVGLWIIKIINRILKKIFDKHQLEVSLKKFLSNLINWVLKIFLFIIVVSKLGIQTSSFVAIIGAAGLAIGLALQGSLANFAGGVLILILKPFKVGDYISSQSGGISGTVCAIDIFNTKLETPQNQRIIVPNGQLSNSSITNYSELDTRRSWIDIGVSYDANLKDAKDILMKVIQKNEYALKDPAPQVVVTNLGDSAVNLSIRVSATNENFWTMREQLLIEGKMALDNAGIGIPFPQRDVHIING